MEYKGKLYGHLGNKRYFDTGKTADDWDALEKRIAELEAENQALRIHDVVGQIEQLFCDCQGCGEVKTVEYCEKCYAENLPDIAS